MAGLYDRRGFLAAAAASLAAAQWAPERLLAATSSHSLASGLRRRAGYIGKLELSYEIFDLPTVHEFAIAREGARLRRDVWVRLKAPDGQEGWGEAAATPYYGETAETVAAELPRLAEALNAAIGDDPFELEKADRELDRSIGHNPSAHAAISMALHDLVGKRLGAPIWKIWGLDPVGAVSSFTIAIDTPDVMRQKVKEAVGYKNLKVKVGTPRDQEVLKIVREGAPQAKIRVDANTGWSPKQAVAALPMLEEFGVELVEQPVRADDLDGLALVRSRSKIPIVADESCRVSSDVAHLVGKVDGVNIKLAKCGSMREALRIVNVARAHGMQVMLGCMVESTLAIAAAIQLAPLVDWVDLDGAALLARDPFVGPGIEKDGSLRFNKEPGLGVTRAKKS
jgi:L-alanine-DL-glutamate epimerase-like enolase superfamily enzyme